MNQIAKKTNGRCFYCNKVGVFEIDYFISKSKWYEWQLDDTPQKGKLSHLEKWKAWSRYYRANYRVGLLLNSNIYQQY